MTKRFSPSKGAIFTVIVGIALFFVSCKALTPPVSEESRRRDFVANKFAIAEKFDKNGEWDKALAAYQAYLRLDPKGEYSAQALHSMGEIFLRREEYKKAAEFFRKILKDFPDYARASVVKLHLSRSLYLLGDFQQAKSSCLNWLEMYPRHPLRGDIFLLLGDIFSALGDRVEAFRWILKAREAETDSLLKESLDNRLETLLEAVLDPDELLQVSNFSLGTPYEPKIHYRLALLFLENNELKKAKARAMALIRSTSDKGWVGKGRALLERIQEELSVREGVVGCLLPLSGTFAIYGEEVLNGIQLGAGMLQVTDGRDGAIRELVIKDTEGDPEKAVSALEDLVENEKVIAVIGPLSSRTAPAVARKAQVLGVPIITLSQRDGITEEGDMVFRNFLTPSREVDKLVQTAISEMGIRRFCILYPDNPYGRFLMNLFWDRLDQAGGVVTAVESYKMDETDFASQIKKSVGLFYPRPYSVVRELMEMRNPEAEESIIFPEEPQPIIDFEAVFIPDNFQKVAMIAPQLVYHDVLDIQLLGTSLWQSDKLIELAGDYIQGSVFTSGFFENRDRPDVLHFVETYTSNFDTAPGILAATGYDTIRFIEMLLAEGTVYTRRDVRDRLLSNEGMQGVTGRISFNASGEVEKDPFLVTISGGRMKIFQ